MNVMTFAAHRAPFSSVTVRQRAALTLAVAVSAGAATEGLFWRTGLGLNFWLWDLFVVGASLILFRRGPLAPTAWGAIAACALLGFAVVRFESGWAVGFAVPTTLGLLTFLPLLLRERMTVTDLACLPARGLRSAAETPRALVAASELPGLALGEGRRGVLRAATRGVLLGAPMAGFFALLLATDHDFAAALAHIRDKIGEVTLFSLWSLFSAAGYLVTHRLHARTGGPLGHAITAAPEDAPYRAPPREPSLEAPAPPAGRVSVVTWSFVIGQVVLVFALFVAANLRHLFGGTALVRAPGGLTYATYLHGGFALLLFATMLSVCLVLTGHALLRPRGGPAGAPVPGGRILAMLEAALLVLTAITVASCWQRLRIYEDAYGASRLRLGVAFVELAIVGVLAVTVVKAVARSWRGHAGALFVLFTALPVLASAFNADAYIARRNLDRAAAGKPLDDAYLASLSRDARPALTHPYVRSHPDLAARLEERFHGPSGRGLRDFRGLGPL